MSINLYEQFEQILKADDLEQFKAFYEQYQMSFEKDDYTLMVKYNSKKIYQWYYNEVTTFKYFDGNLYKLFDLELMYKYIALNTDKEMFIIIKKHILSLFEESIDGLQGMELEEAMYEHPYVYIASYCLAFNSNIELFKYCIKEQPKFFNEFQYIHCTSVEFIKAIFKIYANDEKINRVIYFINEKQLEYVLQDANLRKYYIVDDQEKQKEIIVKLFSNHYISFNFIKSHFKIDINIIKEVSESHNEDAVTFEMLDYIFETYSMEDIRTTLKEGMSITFYEKYKKIIEDEKLRSKFIEVFKDNCDGINVVTCLVCDYSDELYQFFKDCNYIFTEYDMDEINHAAFDI